MLNDRDFDIVYLSEYLKNPLSTTDKGLETVYSNLETVLRKHGCEPRLLPYKNNLVMDGKLSIWCRDLYASAHS
jgi:hypothetical protein